VSEGSPRPTALVPKGQVLFRPGEDCSGFVVVHSGTIRVSLTGESGREIVLYRVHPGEVCLQTFGCLINHRPYSAEGLAESDLEIELVPAGEFRQRVIEDGEFRERLFAAVAARFDDMERLVEDVALTGLEARVAKSLLRLMDGTRVVTATHESIAAEIGSGRAAVSRTLGQLARRGTIEIGRGAIRILDGPALETLSHGEV